MVQDPQKVYRQIATLAGYALTTNGNDYAIIDSSGAEKAHLTNIVDANAALELLAYPPGTIHSGGM